MFDSIISQHFKLSVYLLQLLVIIFSPNTYFFRILYWICCSSLLFVAASKGWLLYKKQLFLHSLKDEVTKQLREEDPQKHKLFLEKRLKEKQASDYEQKIVRLASHLEKRYSDLLSTVQDESSEPSFFNFLHVFFGEPEILAGEPKLVTEQDVYKENTYSFKDCPICLEQFHDKETICTLQQCGHTFHENCWVSWNYLSATCPVCRQVSEIRWRHEHKEAKRWFEIELERLRLFYENLYFAFTYQWMKKPKTFVGACVIYPFWLFSMYSLWFGTWLGWCYMVAFMFVYGEIFPIFLHLGCRLTGAALQLVIMFGLTKIEKEWSAWWRKLVEDSYDILQDNVGKTVNPIGYVPKAK